MLIIIGLIKDLNHVENNAKIVFIKLDIRKLFLQA